MGQQQLLLIVLGVVIVGLAVVTGLNAFKDGARQNAADELVRRNVEIVTKAYVWKMKNDPFAGGNKKYDSLEGNLARIGVQEETLVGVFAIVTAADDALEIVGVSKHYPELGVRTLVTNYDVVSSEVKYDGSIALPAEGG